MMLSVPPPPPPALHASAPRPKFIAEIVAYLPGAVRCGGETIVPLHLEKPFLTTTGHPDSVPPLPQSVFVLNFAIGREGRPMSIHLEPPPRGPMTGDTHDLAPALAASRFAADAPRQGCTIRYTTQTTPMDEAPPALLQEAMSVPIPGPAIFSGYERLWDAEGSDCRREFSAPLVLNYPAPQGTAEPEGARSWSFLRFDVDARGRTRDVRVLASSGNAALDRESRKAIQRNRYVAEAPRHGCFTHFARMSSTSIPAPALPGDLPASNDTLPACAIDRKSIPTLRYGTGYPNDFAMRRIAGVVVMGFDSAPSGEISNIRILASEPASDFGASVQSAFLRAQVAPTGEGHQGCVTRVHFKLPDGPRGR